MRPRLSQDLLAGLLFAGFGVLALVLSSEYAMGTAQRMGPGYFPTLLGWALLVLGAVITGRAVVLPAAALPAWSARAVLVVAGAVVAFGLLLERAGLVVATLALVLVGGVAARRVGLAEAAVAYLALLLFGTALFVYALGLPIRLW